MFNSLNTKKQDEALSLLEIDNRDKLDTKDSFKELVVPVFESVFPSNSITENISLVIIQYTIVFGVLYLEITKNAFYQKMIKSIYLYY